MIFGTTSIIGCSGSQSHEEHSNEASEQKSSEAKHVHYACPMDCEDGKVYEEPGTCPVCKMDLAEVVETETHTATNETHNHEHEFACPMHPEITGHEDDKCSECGMDLTEIEPE